MNKVVHQKIPSKILLGYVVSTQPSSTEIISLDEFDKSRDDSLRILFYPREIAFDGFGGPASYVAGYISRKDPVTKITYICGENHKSQTFSEEDISEMFKV